MWVYGIRLDGGCVNVFTLGKPIELCTMICALLRETYFIKQKKKPTYLIFRSLATALTF